MSNEIASPSIAGAVASPISGARERNAAFWLAVFRRFADIGVKLSTQMELDELLALILSEARSFTHADAGSLYVVEGKELLFRVSQNDTLVRRGEAEGSQFHDIRLPIARTSLAGMVALEGKTINIPDCTHHPMHNKSVDRKLNYHTQTMVVVPMRNHTGEVIGVLQLINALDDKGRVEPFAEGDHLFIESLASQAAVALENAQLYQELQNLFDALVKMCAKAIDARDPCTAGHSSRVAAYTVRIAKKMGGFSEDQLRELRYAAFLHDIGKIGVREHVLTKQNKLYPPQLRLIAWRLNAYKLSRERDLLKELVAGRISAEEFQADREQFSRHADEILAFIEKVNIPGFLSDEHAARIREVASITFTDAGGIEQPLLEPEEVEALLVVKGNLTDSERRDIQSHVVYSYEILKAIPFKRALKHVPEIAGRHHEKLDGTGYPDGLRAKDIPLGARVLAVADVFEALTAQDRPYKPPMPNDKALQIIDFGVKDGHFDAQVAKALRECLESGLIAPQPPKTKPILAKRKAGHDEDET